MTKPEISNEIDQLDKLHSTFAELIAICDNFSFKDSAEPVKALRAVLEHLKGWRDWESRWRGHMSMTILADEERNAKWRLVKELTAIIEKELS